MVYNHAQVNQPIIAQLSIRNNTYFVELALDEASFKNILSDAQE